MECDLTEVSGQMALPLPLMQPQAPPSQFPLLRLSPRPHSPLFASISGPHLDFQRLVSMVRDGARMALTRGSSLDTWHGNSSRRSIAR